MAVTVEGIVEAGSRLVERSGWARLSLRAVAGEVGVTPMALYRHVPDADALSVLVLENIMRASPKIESTGELAVGLCHWARELRDYLVRFDGVAGWLLSHWFDSPATVERVEDLLALAEEHGIVGFEAVAVTNAVFTYVLMRCEAERVIRTAGAVKRSLNTAGGAVAMPRLMALAGHYTTAEFDTHFDYGLEALVSGLLSKATT